MGCLFSKCCKEGGPEPDLSTSSSIPSRLSVPDPPDPPPLSSRLSEPDLDNPLSLDCDLRVGGVSVQSSGSTLFRSFKKIMADIQMRRFMPNLGHREPESANFVCTSFCTDLLSIEPGETIQLEEDLLSIEERWRELSLSIESIQLEEDVSSEEKQAHTAERSVEVHNTAVDVNPDIIQSVEERKNYSQPPTVHNFSLMEKKDFLKSFELMLEQAKAKGIDVVGQIFQIANFAAAILDCHGGCLSINDLDVHLYVPPDAIAVGKQQQVYIFVTGTSSVDTHSFSTPFVHCGPADTVFDKDVVLTMPHCVKDTSSCKFSLSKLSSGGSSEVSEGVDVITVVDNDSITFSVNHLCGFGATASPVDGTILKKSMIACLFIREADDEVELRLRLVDDVKINVEEVENEEEKYGFYLADSKSPLIVGKNNRDVVAKISNFSESWEITEPKSCKQRLNHALLWRETTASFPSVMFFAKRCSCSEEVCFKARMTVYHESNVTYSVDAKQNRSSPPVSDRDTQVEQIGQIFLDQMERLQLTNVKSSMSGSRLLEEPIFNKLCNLMDDPNPLENDWRKLLNLLLKTDDLGCSVSINSIDAKAGRERRSPTEIVLNLFFGKQSGKTRYETMDILKCALIGMNRPDAQFAVDAINNG